MKVSIRHDGSGNFVSMASPDGGRDKDEEGMRLMFAQVAEGIGQALLFAAGRRGMPMGKCLVTVEGESDRTAFLREGIAVTVEAAGTQETLDVWLNEALAHCFPEGTLVCPLRHTVIATT